MMKYLTLSTLLIAVVAAMAFFKKKSAASIPDHWVKGMFLSYENSYGMSGEFNRYQFFNDSVHVYTRFPSKNGYKEEKYDKPMSSKQLDTLLKILKENHVDKMTMRRTGEILYDGTAYSLQLRINDKFLINLSNSAYEELEKTYETHFWSAVGYIQKLAASK